MTDNREKLIKLLLKVGVGHDRLRAGHIADFLIENGVTFATDTNDGCKWIPVAERLPERGKRVLCYMNFSGVPQIGFPEIIITDNEYQGILVGSNPRKHIWEWQGDFVTHWMPLPEAPKEE